MTGIELKREARKLRPDLPIILVSGRSDVAGEAADSGDHRFFRKPFDGSALLLAIDDVLREKTQRTPRP